MATERQGATEQKPLNQRAGEVAAELALDLQDSVALRDFGRYVAKLEREVDALKGVRDELAVAAGRALDYLLNAQSRDFAMGSDAVVRHELARVLGVEI
jgi:hypothetical protein